MRWLLALLVALLLFNWIVPWLQKLGLGRLPGDFEWRIRGRTYYLPIGTSVVLSLLMTLIGKLI